jgi:transposase-like protein
MSTIPKAYPREFRDDVVAVAQRREAGVTIKQIADDFGIPEGCLQNWLRQAEIEPGKRPGTTQAESEELWELRKRNRLLEQENEVLFRAAAHLSQANLRGKGSTRS